MKLTALFCTSVFTLCVALLAPSLSLASQTTSYKYNTLGLVSSEDGPRTDLQDITSYVYTSEGYLAGVTNALNQSTQILDYNTQGMPGRIIDANGVVTELTYNGRRLLTSQSIVNPETLEKTTTTYVYDKAGLLIQVTLPNNTSITYTYDDARRLVKITNSLNESIEYTLDAAGNRTQEIIASSDGNIQYQAQQVFDELSRLIKTLDSSHQETGFSLDANGNTRLLINPRNHETQQAFDALNRVSQVTEANSAQTHYGYDAQGRLSKVTDANGNVTEYTYNAYDQLTRQQSPDTGISTFTYDQANNQTSATDARGIRVDYVYDALNRITQISYDTAPEENIRYTYDQGSFGIGRLSRIDDQSGSTSFEYNHLGLITQLVSTIADSSFTTAYAYNTAGQLESLTNPSGIKAVYEYSEGQVSAVSVVLNNGSLQALATNIQHLPFGPISVYEYGNGIEHTMTYNQNYQLTKQVIGSVLDRQYTYDANNNILSITSKESNLDDQSFTYNSVDRISYATGSQGQRQYDYDLVGNRTQFQLTQDSVSQLSNYYYAANRLDQITGDDNRAYQYDPNGNPLEESSTLTLESTYNHANRLSSIKTANGLVTYRYNALGQRVAKTHGGQTTYFVYGKSGQLIFEKAQATKAYFYLENQPLAMITNQSQATGAFYLENKYTGYRIAAPSNTQGARLITVTGSTNSPEVQFEKVLKDDSYFYLKNKATGFHMRPVSNANGSTLEQVPNTYIGNRTQWFDALSTDGNFLHIRNRWTGKNIRPINDTLGNQIEIRPTHWSGNWTQWTLVPVLSQSTQTEIYYYHNDHLGTPPKHSQTKQAKSTGKPTTPLLVMQT